LVKPAPKNVTLEQQDIPPIKVSPSILASDFSRLGEEVRAIVDAGADMVHIDVMDGHFTPNITIGIPVVAALREHCGALMDVHLMIDEPERYVADFADAGADIISFHIEAARHPHRILSQIKDLGLKAGVVLNPGTSEDTIEFVVEQLDMVLIMTVNPGFGGQAFIPEMLRKIQNVRAMIGNRDLEVDGGIDLRTAPMVIEAGANVLVAGSYVFRANSYMEAIDSLKACGK